MKYFSFVITILVLSMPGWLLAQDGGTVPTVPTSSGSDAAAIGPARPGVPNPHAGGGVPTTSSGAPADVHGTPENLPPLEPGDGVLTGRLVRQTQGDSSLGGLDVRLFAFENQQRVGEWRSETADDGSFRFTKLNTRPTLKYIASALFEGVVYLSDGGLFETGKGPLEAEIKVYDSAPAPGPLKIDSLHVILQIDPNGGTMQVTEVIAFNNPGDKTLVGGKEDTVTLTLDLPAGATDVQPLQGFMPTQVSVSDKALFYTGPLYPGTNQLVFSYQIAPQPSWLFRRRLPFPAETVDVFVPSDGPAVLSRELTRSEPLNIQGSRFERYTGGPFSAGTGVTFQVGGVEGVSSSSPTRVPAVPIAAALGIGLAAFVLAPLLRKRPQPGAAGTAAPRAVRKAQLIKQRERALEAVRELDFDHECGKLAEEDYQRLRAQHKQLAIEAMQQLEALEGGGTAGASGGATAGASDGGALSTSMQAQAMGEGRAGGKAAPLKFCTTCGTAIEPEDRFCGGCGNKLRVVNG